MSVSIAMATYNGGTHLSEQLQSFLDQTVLPDELVVTDDGSTDDTLEILKTFSETAPFEVKVFQNEQNLGYAHNFAKAMQLCSQELVFLCDQDDVWFPEKVEYVLALAEAHPKKVLFMTDARLTDGDLNPTPFTMLGQIADAGKKRASFLVGCCMAVRQSFLAPVLPIPEVYWQHDFWLADIADLFDGRLIDDHVAQYYRRHESTTTSDAISRPQQIEQKSALGKLKGKLAHEEGFKAKFLREEIAKMESLPSSFERLAAGGPLAPAARRGSDVLAKRLAAYKNRYEVVTAGSMPGRAVRACAMFFRGHYSSFHGFKSCLADIMRN